MVTDEDQVARILEHPLSHYTTTDGDETPGHEHKLPEDRKRCARRQVMTTEYTRTICKSAERRQVKKSLDRASVQQLSEEAYGYKGSPTRNNALSQAALGIPSFQEYAKRATDIETME